MKLNATLHELLMFLSRCNFTTRQSYKTIHLIGIPNILLIVLQMATKSGETHPNGSEDMENVQRTWGEASSLLFSAVTKEGFKQILDSNQREELKRMRDFITVHGLAKLQEYMANEETRQRNTPLNIAVIGNAGVGKTTFINTIRGLLPTDEGAAVVDVEQATLVPTPFADPSSPNLIYWDLPGLGTPEYPIETYKEQISFHRYDFFLVLSCTRFTTSDAWLAIEAQKVEKPCFFART